MSTNTSKKFALQNSEVKTGDSPEVKKSTSSKSTSKKFTSKLKTGGSPQVKNPQVKKSQVKKHEVKNPKVENLQKSQNFTCQTCELYTRQKATSSRCLFSSSEIVIRSDPGSCRFYAAVWLAPHMSTFATCKRCKIPKYALQ